MEILTILYIIIGVLTVSNIFFIWRGTKLVKEVEDRVNDYDELVQYSIQTLERMQTEMKEIDIRGSFESDDEVGVVFNELKDTIDKYKNNL
jgi:hypothetical protein